MGIQKLEKSYMAKGNQEKYAWKRLSHLNWALNYEEDSVCREGWGGEQHEQKTQEVNKSDGCEGAWTWSLRLRRGQGGPLSKLNSLSFIQ